MKLPFNFLVVLALLLTLIAVNSGAAEGKKPAYYANEYQSLLNLTTPYGSRVFLGDFGFDRLRSYTIEIPLADLKPPPSEDGGGGDGNGGGGQKRGGVSAKDLQADDDQLVLQANRLYNQGKFQDALTTVDELLRRNPDNVRALVMRGSMMHALGEKEMARKSWTRAAELEPSNQEIQNILQNYR